MASAELSRRVEKVVGYPPLSEMGELQGREFHDPRLLPHGSCGVGLLVVDHHRHAGGSYEQAEIGLACGCRSKPGLITGGCRPAGRGDPE
jgi:hypothetical protein